MKIIEIFEKVNLIFPLEQRRFFSYFEDTVTELLAMYDKFVIKENTEYTPPNVLSDECVVLPLYCNAVADNILFLSGAGEQYKSEFLRKSREAYLKYWSDNAKGKRVKRMRW